MTELVLTDADMQVRQDDKLAVAIRTGNVRVGRAGTRPTGHMPWEAHDQSKRATVYLEWGKCGQGDFAFLYVLDIDGDREEGTFFVTLGTHADKSGYVLEVMYVGGFPDTTQVISTP